MNLTKQFFYFTKSKFFTFLILSLIILYFTGQQNMVLGNYTLLMQAAVILTLYFILNILWFSFKSKKHFLIGLVTFILLILILWVSGNYSTQKRSAAYDECVKEGYQIANSENFKGGVMNCMDVEDNSTVEDYSTQSRDARADYFFQKWIISWKNEDYSTLSKVFGSTDGMAAYNSRVMMMNYKNNILAYDKYVLYKSTSIPATVRQIEVYGNDLANNIKVTAFYIVSKSEYEYNILIIWGNYEKNKNNAEIDSYIVYSEENEPMPGLPPEYKPKAFNSIKDAQLQIDKLYNICISQNRDEQRCAIGK